MSARALDPDFARQFPRAPSAEAWAAMSQSERVRCVEQLPAWMTEAELLPPEGDPHREAKSSAHEALRRFFDHMKRRAYIGVDLTVYYPDERRFSPDVFVVFDVDPKSRSKWVVSAEGKGLDFVLEILVSGDRKKDLEHNVKFYASLGIPEYFVYDRSRQRLLGYRLASAERREYSTIVPQAGRFISTVLGLDLNIESDRLRFHAGNAPLLDSAELLVRLEQVAEQAARRAEDEARHAEDEARRAEDEARRAEDEARRAEGEARRAEGEAQRADALARRVAELEAELRRRS
jgi:Uma2 family endonuclease